MLDEELLVVPVEQAELDDKLLAVLDEELLVVLDEELLALLLVIYCGFFKAINNPFTITR